MSLLPTARFLRHYLRPRPGIVESAETTYHRDGDELEATVYRPAASGGRLPGWVVLHGLTYPGRKHTSLIPFLESIAASGAVVMAPDIPEWRRLRIDPEVTVPTIRAAILALDERPDTIPGRIGVLGFSFGATQALIAAADERLGGHLSAVAAWGGYYDLHNLFEFGITGEYALDGERYRLEPDPYGRWIVGGNYLTEVPGHEHETEVAQALQTLALEAGRRRIYAGSPEYDPYKAEVRATLPPDQHATYDLFAPPAGESPPDLDHARALARDTADAALRSHPLLDPRPYLGRLRVRTLLAHARDDRIIPFTEGIRLSRAIDSSCTVTELFAHSGGTAHGLGPIGLGREALRFARLLHRILGLV